MGEVYAARQLRLGKRVAVKFLRRELSGDRRCVERFEREVRSLAAVSDAHVVQILDCGETSDGVPYFVMEHLVGEDLERALGCAPLDLARVLRLAEGACQGLAAVHAAGLVHRDIKPANLFLVAERYSERCKILDFGVVKLGSTSSTRGGAILGTVRYMAPEQLIDSASVGAACDLYGLGAVLYQCLTGRLPHAADSEPELMFEILNRPAPPLAKLRPDLPVALTALVDQALAKDPGARPSSAHVFHERLAEAREHTTLSVHTARSTVSELTGERLSALGARRRALKLQRNRTLFYWGVGLTLGVGVAAGAAWRSRTIPPSVHGNALRLATKSVASTGSIAPSFAAAKPVPSGPTATPSALAT